MQPVPSEEHPQTTAHSNRALPAVPAINQETTATAYQPTVHRATQQITDDWPAILERRSLRVLVTPSRTNFFLAQNRSRGFELEMFRQLEEQFNKQHPDDVPFRVVFVPVAYDQLIPSLLAGYGDVAAAMLTVTEQRQQQVAFTSPYLSDVSEVIVRHNNAPAITTTADLSSKTIVVAAGTGYLETLARTNEQLTAAGQKPMRVLAAGHGLVSEDILELVHSGSFDYTLIDRPVAELWSHVLDDIALTDVALAEGRQIAWAVRPNNPQLLAQLNNWAETNKKGSLLGNILFKRYYTDTKWLQSPLVDYNDRWETYRPLFEEASEKYGYDWHLLAMQGYQESRLDPSKASHSGAEGIMQLLPATAKDMGCTDTRHPRANIMAGAKYMDWLRTHLFADQNLTEGNRIAFCLAAYNAGFGRVRRWREDAPQLGYDPNQWFNLVEHVALQQTSMEPVRYVGNIIKTNTAFSLYSEQADRRQETVDQLSK